MSRKVVLIMLLILFASPSHATSYYYFELFPTRVGVVNAIHDFWYESNLTAANDLANLGIQAIKLWPTEHYLSPDMQAIYNDPRFDVIVIRPLQNSPIVTETGCDGKQYSYFRWENIDYGQVAMNLYATLGHLDKVIVLTGWENDHQLKGLGCGNRIPSQAEIDSYTAMLTARENGVRAAWSAYPNATLRVYHAVEVNHVFSSSFRVIDEILPTLTPKPTLISYSHWSGSSITDTVNYIANAMHLPAHRIIIGELGAKERTCCVSQYPYLYSRYSEAFDLGVKLVFMWTYRDQFNCPTNAGRWLRRCDNSLATSYDALMDLKQAYE
jgi:hypothetical protein